jgi:hypothetical protein
MKSSEIKVGELVSWRGELIRRVSGISGCIVYFENGLPNGTKECNISDLMPVNNTTYASDKDSNK